MSNQAPRVLLLPPEMTKPIAKQTKAKSQGALAGLLSKRSRELGKLSRSRIRSPRSSSSSKASQLARRGAAAANYEPRVLAGEFEPTAVKAREIARRRHTSLHELAHELGFADAPPKLRRAVELSSLTRTELAERTGYHISDLSRMLAGKHPPTLSKLARVAAAYGVWLDDLLEAIGF